MIMILKMSPFEERAYPSLVGIDFTNLDKKTAFGPTYATRGGEKTVTTPEQQAQERREALELMVVYTDPKDIPPSAKEPPHGDTGPVQQERTLKGPNQPWVVQRLQEAQHYGPEYASQLLQQRKLMSKQSSPHTPSTNVDTVLQQLSGPQLSHTMNPLNQPQISAALENLQRIVTSLKGKSFPPTEPPDWMTNPEQRADWWDGYNRDNPDQVKAQADAQIAQLRAGQFQPPPMPLPQAQLPAHPMIVNPFPAPPQPNAAAPDMAQQVQAYLASLQPGSNGSAPTQQQYDYNGWAGNNTKDREPDGYDQQKRWDGEREKDNARPKKKQGHSKSNNSKDRGYDMKHFDGGQ